jgi:hypothetical protein
MVSALLLQLLLQGVLLCMLLTLHAVHAVAAAYCGGSLV